MPSSLTTFHSFTLGYSPHPPVSVYGTDILQLPTELFSPADSTRLVQAEAIPRHQLSACAYSLRRSIHKTARASFRCPWWFDTARRGRNVNRLSIGYAFGASP